MRRLSELSSALGEDLAGHDLSMACGASNNYTYARSTIVSYIYNINIIYDLYIYI